MTEHKEMNGGEEVKQHTVSFPSDYSDVQSRSYDPEYISDISNKMQIPDRISIGEPNDLPNTGSGRNSRLSGMQVPDRIIVAGEEKHIGLKEGIRELELTNIPSAENLAYVGLLTPPRTLTLEERFPVVEDEVEKHNRLTIQKNDANNSHLYSSAPTPYTPGYSPNDSILVNEEDEATVLRLHVAKLSRRVVALEHDSQRRSQREVLLYPMVMGYFVLRFFFWFFKSK